MAEIYIDIESGTTQNRTNLQRMLTDMSQNKFDIILAKELSRLSRNGALSYAIRDFALKYDIKIITLDNAINMVDNNIDLFGMYTWLYEQEAQTTSNRVKATLSSQAKKGRFMGSIPPYGYEVENKKLIIKSDYSPDIVKRIFTEYLGGKGFDRIALDLTADHIPTPGQVSRKTKASPCWHGSTIRKIIENRHYIGDLVQGKETTISVTNRKRRKINSDNFIIAENTHAPIITSEVFLAVQEMIMQRKKTPCAPQVRLFSNLVFCLECGKSMHYRQNRKGYVCSTYSKSGVKHCSSHLIKEDYLISLILQELNELLTFTSINYDIRQIKTRIVGQQKRLTKQINFFQKRLEQIKQENSGAFTQMVKGFISRDEYEVFIGSIEQDPIPTQTQLDQLLLLLTQFNEVPLADKLLHIVKHRHIIKLTPIILNMFISKIEIGENNLIRIYYKCNNDFNQV